MVHTKKNSNINQNIIYIFFAYMIIMFVIILWLCVVEDSDLIKGRRIWEPML